MDISRIVSVSCVLLLALCFLLSVYAITVMHGAMNQSTALCMEMQSLLNQTESELTEDTALKETAKEDSVPVDVLADRFCIREIDGRVAIYTEDGYLVRLLEISAETLPATDRLALQRGIHLSSWKEVLALIEDFEA